MKLEERWRNNCG